MVVKHMIGLWSDCDRTVDRTVIWLWSDCQWIRPPPTGRNWPSAGMAVPHQHMHIHTPARFCSSVLFDSGRGKQLSFDVLKCALRRTSHVQIIGNWFLKSSVECVIQYEFSFFWFPHFAVAPEMTLDRYPYPGAIIGNWFSVVHLMNMYVHYRNIII